MKYLKTMSLSFFIFGILIFGYSLHNVDLAFNARYGAIDQNFLGYEQDIPKMHINAMGGFEIAIVFIIIGFLLLFYSKEVDL